MNECLPAGHETFLEQEKRLVWSEAYLLRGSSYPQDLSELTKNYYFLISLFIQPTVEPATPMKHKPVSYYRKTNLTRPFPFKQLSVTCLQEWVKEGEHSHPGDILPYRTFNCLLID